MAPQDTARRTQLAAALQALHGRVERACAAAGRDPSEVSLIAVTKTYPAADVVLLAELGVTDVGENRDQEAAAKAAAVHEAGVARLGHAAGAGLCDAVAADDRPALRWHYVGRLQRNKCASVVSYADVVHSVDSLRLVEALGTAARRHRDRVLDVLVQVSIDGDPSRGGAVDDAETPDADLWRVADAVADAEGLRLAGLMAVAPLDGDPERAFAGLAGLAARLRARHPAAVALSAGMSGDLEAAVKYGATHVRIGSALLGMRNTLR